MRNHLKWGSLIFILACSLAAYAQDDGDSDGQAASSNASSSSSAEKTRQLDGGDGVPQSPRD